MKPCILLMNPPIYHFFAYDFWLKPYGLLRVAGLLRDQAHLSLLDYLDRLDPRVPRRHYGSTEFAHNLGTRVMLSESSPIPGTPDGKMCLRWLDLDEPLWHNKNAFVIQSRGIDGIDRLRNLAARLNQRLGLANIRTIGLPGPEYVRDAE